MGSQFVGFKQTLYQSLSQSILFKAIGQSNTSFTAPYAEAFISTSSSSSMLSKLFIKELSISLDCASVILGCVFFLIIALALADGAFLLLSVLFGIMKFVIWFSPGYFICKKYCLLTLSFFFFFFLPPSSSSSSSECSQSSPPRSTQPKPSSFTMKLSLFLCSCSFSYSSSLSSSNIA